MILQKFDQIFTRMQAYLTNREVYVRDAYACADQRYRLNVRIVTEYPWQNLFANNLFLRPTNKEIETIQPRLGDRKCSWIYGGSRY
jgi:phosphoenolpyruvate carboxykinase (ATP)